MIMAARVPTERQYATLLTLGSGSALLTGRKRDIDPLLHHQWVTADHGYAWVRITPQGLHARSPWRPPGTGYPR